MKKILSFVLMLPLCYATPPLSAFGQNASQDLTYRLQRLEQKTQELRNELTWLREHPVRLPEVMAAVPASATMYSAPSNNADYYTLDELKYEMRKLAWRKGEFSITPYGALWGNMAYSSQKTRSGSYTMYVFSRSDHSGDEFLFDGRMTRLGIDVGGPRLHAFCCAKSGGRLEIDFEGNFSGTENRGGILLRHAYWEIKNRDFRLLLGQTWDVISPLNPTTTMYSVYWAAGNIGYRRAQLRGEGYLRMSDSLMLTLQGSLNSSIVSDFASTANITGESSAWPLIEGRVATTIGPRGKGCKPIVLGFSGHIGEQQVDYLVAPIRNDAPHRTWSANFDMVVPVTDRLSVKGEYYVGENMATFLGGIQQGIDPLSRRGIRDTGGWVEVSYDWSYCCSTNVGYTLDDPFDQDLTTPGQRTYNQAIFANILYNVTPKFTMGVEVASWKTLYNNKLPGEAVRVEFMGKYGF